MVIPIAFDLLCSENLCKEQMSISDIYHVTVQKPTEQLHRRLVL